MTDYFRYSRYMCWSRLCSGVYFRDVDMFREHKCYGSSVSSLGRINIVVHGPDSLLKSHVGL